MSSLSPPSSGASSSAPNVLSLTRRALASNQTYQESLGSLAESLRSELAAVEKLLEDVEQNVTSKGIDAVTRTWPDERVVLIKEGWVGLNSIIGRKQIFSEDSPFYEDANRHKRYRDLTTPKPFTNKERTALISAVRNENMRLRARELVESGATDALERVRNMPSTEFEQTHDGLDWDRIASQIPRTSYYTEPRTAQECKVQWLGADRPEVVNTVDRLWKEEEDAKLRSLVGEKDYKGGEVDWVVVATDLGGTRLPAQCLSRFLSLEGFSTLQPKKAASAFPQRPSFGIAREKEQWTPEEDAELLKAVRDCGAGNWRAISLALSTLRTPAACAQRYRSSLDPTIKKGDWTQSEDERLKEAVAIYGTQWSKVSTLMKGRTGPQCRERYVRRTSLAGTKAGKWTDEEDQKLRQAVSVRGLTDWNAISDFVGNRMGQQCQRRWAVLQKKGDALDAAESNKKLQQGRRPKRKPKNKEKSPSDRAVSSDASPDEDRPDVQLPRDERESGAQETAAAATTRRSARLKSLRG